MRAESPSPEVLALLTGREQREGNGSWRPRGTPTALLIYSRAGNAAWPMLGRASGGSRLPLTPMRDRIEAGLIEMDRNAHSALPRAVDLAMNALARPAVA
jgi:hypothetical protein